MEKKTYSKPSVVSHELITFETLLSCNPPNIPGQTLPEGTPICLKPDGSGWFPR